MKLTFRKKLIGIGDSFRTAGGYHRAVEEIFDYKQSLVITR
jgi:hypothetical protein